MIWVYQETHYKNWINVSVVFHISSSSLYSIFRFWAYFVCCLTGPCDSRPCQNGGTCSNNNDGSYTCRCLSGYSGKDCGTSMFNCLYHTFKLVINNWNWFVSIWFLNESCFTSDILHVVTPTTNYFTIVKKHTWTLINLIEFYFRKQLNRICIVILNLNCIYY